MLKKIRIILLIFAIVFSVLMMIGVIFILDGVGIVDLGGSNSANSSISRNNN